MSVGFATTRPEQFTQFGDLLRFLRIRAGMNQRELAIAVGYSEAQISRLEKGQRRPDLDTIRATFLAALDLDAAPEWAERLIVLASGTSLPDGTAALSAPPPLQPPPPTHPAPVPGILTTKLFRPNPRPNAIIRSRLIRQLSGALQVPFTLLAAPAGFGKTTLLASWLQALESEPQAATHLQHAVAWLSLDANDNDLARFMRHVIAALRHIGSTLGASTLALLDAPHIPPPTALLTPLLNELSALSVRGIIVLDDYHLITTSTIHDLIAVLIERLPPTMHLIIATRADPPLPLTRLRARSQMLDLRAVHLRFRDEEAEHFFRKTMALDLDDAAIRTLSARTEGWVTGLQLIALALEEQGDRERFIADFTGSNRYVLDYLAEEILDRLPAHLRQFLLQTAILDRFCGEACDALLGLPASEQDNYSRLMLAELERRNLFLVPLDSERRWYRYHQLFADVLREQLRQGASREQISELYRRAADWFESQQFVVEGMNYARAGGDPAQIVRIIERHADWLLRRGKYRILNTWLTYLPETTIRANPRLILVQAYQLFIAQNPAGVQQCLDDVAHLLQTTAVSAQERQRLESESAVLASGLAVNCGDYALALDRGRLALAGLPEDHLWLRGETLLYIGLAHAHMSQYDEGMPHFREAHRVSLAAGDLHHALYALCTGAGLERMRGHLRAALDLYQQGIALAEQHQVLLMPVMGLLHADHAEVLYELNQIAAAIEQAQAAITNAEQNGSMRFLAVGKMNLARLYWVQGDHQRAESLFLQAAELIQRHQMSAYHVMLHANFYVPVLIQSGRVDTAAQWLAQHGVTESDTPSVEAEMTHLVRARVLLAQGEHVQLQHYLVQLRTEFLAAQRNAHLVLVYILEALNAHALGELPAALSALEAALALAAQDGYIRTFLDEGAPLIALLHHMQPQTAYAELCAELIRLAA
jgi:LuxR family maltose regulon positive regulatory protein